MLLGGDEFRRTQGGNNNAYCQDNETSWIDWTCLERHPGDPSVCSWHDRISRYASGAKQEQSTRTPRSVGLAHKEDFQLG